MSTLLCRNCHVLLEMSDLQIKWGVGHSIFRGTPRNLLSDWSLHEGYFKVLSFSVRLWKIDFNNRYIRFQTSCSIRNQNHIWFIEKLIHAVSQLLNLISHPDVLKWPSCEFRTFQNSVWICDIIECLQDELFGGSSYVRISVPSKLFFIMFWRRKYRNCRITFAVW